MRYINEVREKLISGELSVVEYIAGIFELIKKNKSYNVYITVCEDEAMKRARELDEKLASGAVPGKLFGVPVSFKDNIMTKGIRTTCASKMLENFVPPYDATVVKKALAEDAVIIGKTNMDEFAMGASSETSYFGPTKNPLNPELVPGGSSSGAAVSLKLGESVVAIGSDTGGSVRQPASYCSVLGYLPSYGNISRYGVTSMANSLDQVGIFANSVEDIMTMFNIIGGCDERDATSTRVVEPNFKLSKPKAADYKIGFIKDIERFGCDKKVADDYYRAVKLVGEMGAELVEFEPDLYKYLSPTYSVVSTAEVSSNMSKFDGIRYGYRCSDYDGLDELYEKTRSEGFNEETQRRIAVGMFYLGSKYEVELYKKALKVRTLIKNWVEGLFREMDLILTPSAINLPYELGKADDTLAAFDSGDFHVLVNLTGRCAISIPMNEGIGGSVQFIGDRYEDEKLLNFANAFVKEVK